MEVEKSVGVVTGGASGLGEGCVRMLVGGGGRAVVLDLPNSKGPAMVEELGADKVRFVEVDVAAPDQVERAMAAAHEAFGRIDVLANCAGVSPASLVLSRNKDLYPLDVFRRGVDINLNGLFDMVRWGAYFMSDNEPSEEGERGLIVNVASIAGYEGQAGQAAYAASKGGVIALTLPLARDLARWGIRVMAIAPGIMDTGMLAGIDEERRAKLIDIHVFPKRLGRPDDFARLVRCFMEDTLLNGEVVRLDAATRLNVR
ncbi:MAG TPA: SDR family NAD(P)-dependent oxidoreductase [Solirubrobacteraceae bacterium]|nr:SDR family NAD(P)-dependent oxidoreductase [Solirubrobacteraceae bacterium]